MKNVFILIAIIALTSCSTAKTHVINPIDLSKSPTFTLTIYNDTEKLFENISNRIRQLGFEPNSDNDQQPEYTIFVDYITYWDVAYQTFEHFVLGTGQKNTSESS